jgi:hypothetical protein
MNKPNLRQSPARGNERSTVGSSALTAWRRELAAGHRTATTFDALWRAACLEANALESAGTPGVASHYLADARRLMPASAPTAFDLAMRRLRHRRRMA